jgi:Arc-like DNA binding domain
LPRKPVDIAHVNLRIREHLRKRLEAAAKRNRISLNGEIMQRLEASFEEKPQVDIVTINQVIAELENAWARLTATREVLALVDLLTTKILEHNVRDEFGRELPGEAWTEFGRDLSVYARDVRRLRATVDLPLSWARHPGESQP